MGTFCFYHRFSEKYGMTLSDPVRTIIKIRHMSGISLKKTDPWPHNAENIRRFATGYPLMMGPIHDPAMLG